METKKERAQAILTKAYAEIRTLGLAPIFKWGQRIDAEGKTTCNKMATNINDFIGFHEVNDSK